MLWPLGILLLLGGAWFLMTRKRPAPIDPTPPGLSEPPDDFQAELAHAITMYEKDQLACALRRLVILEGHSDALLQSFEAQYGRCEGVPFLDLPGEWNDNIPEGIRIWMTRNGLLFSEGALPIQQLEQALEARIAQQARAILECETKGDCQTPPS